MLSGWQAIVASQDDGSFQIAVPPGKGHLLVFGPTGDYVLGEIGSNRLYDDQPGGRRYHAHAIIPYEVKAGDPPHEVAAALRPGVTIKGRVEGPDGQTVDRRLRSSRRSASRPCNPFWRGDYQIPVRDGRFELHGLDPEATARIHVLDAEHEWGASVEVSGKQAGEDADDPASALRPGQGAVRRARRQALAKHQPHFEFVATPGPSRYSRNKQDQAELAADAELRRQRRPQALLELRRAPTPRAASPCPADPRRTVPDHRLLDRQRRGEGHAGPQGLHRQARRDARPGRYPDREAASRMMMQAPRIPRPRETVAGGTRESESDRGPDTT